MSGGFHGGPLDRGMGASPSGEQPKPSRREASFEMFFKVRWAQFLRENFRSPEEIGVHFGVSARTAQNWLDEFTVPRGHCVALAFKFWPGRATKWLIGEGSNDISGDDNNRARMGRDAGRVAGPQNDTPGVSA